METLGPERATVRTIKWQWADDIQRNKLETKAVDGTIPEAKVIQRHFYSPPRYGISGEYRGEFFEGKLVSTPKHRRIPRDIPRRITLHASYNQTPLHVETPRINAHTFARSRARSIRLRSVIANETIITNLVTLESSNSRSTSREIFDVYRSSWDWCKFGIIFGRAMIRDIKGTIVARTALSCPCWKRVSHR